jgi:hypothetical protein
VDLGAAVVADEQSFEVCSQAKVRSTTQRWRPRPWSSFAAELRAAIVASPMNFSGRAARALDLLGGQVVETVEKEPGPLGSCVLARSVEPTRSAKIMVATLRSRWA